MVFTKLRECQSHLEYWNTGIAVTFINMTAQDRAATGQHLTHIFKYDWSDPSFVLGNELNPMDSEDSRNVITDMG